MASESSPSANLITRIPKLPDDLHSDLEIFESSINYPFNLNASTDGAVGFTETAFSAPHTASLLGNSSVPMLRQAEDIFGQPNDHHQPQGHHEYPYNLGLSFPTPRISDLMPNPLGDDFPPNNDCNPLVQLHNYTFNQTWPASSDHSNDTSELHDATFGLEYSMPNEFSDPVSWNADDPFVPAETPVHSLGQRSIVQKQVFTPLIEGQNIPRFMVSYPSIALRHMNLIESQRVRSRDKLTVPQGSGYLSRAS